MSVSGRRSILGQMRLFGFFFAFSLLVLGCGKEVRQAFDGIYCSHENEDPMYVCSKAYDLVCITTDRHINTMTGMLGPERYLCRTPCKPGDRCAEGVCCPGKVYGKDLLGTSHACVPISFCENPPDAGVRDAARADTSTDATDAGNAGPETGSDAASDAGDAGATDAPASDAVDAPVDSPTDAPDDAAAG